MEKTNIIVKDVRDDDEGTCVKGRFMFQRSSEATGLFTSKNILFIYLKITHMYSFVVKVHKQTEKVCATDLIIVLHLCVSLCVWTRF